eukprot:7657154-Alexandrium_andersonii.AAC.1
MGGALSLREAAFIAFWCLTSETQPGPATAGMPMASRDSVERASRGLTERTGVQPEVVLRASFAELEGLGRR